MVKINNDNESERVKAIKKYVNRYFKSNPHPKPVFTKNPHKPYAELLKSASPSDLKNVQR